MLYVLFFVFLIWMLWKLIVFGIKAAWSLSKFLVTAVLFPLLLIGLAAAGLLYFAFPVMIIAGIAAAVQAK